MLRDVVVVGRRCPRSMPLAMLTMKKELHRFYFYACMWFCSYNYGAPLDSPWGRQSSAIKTRFKISHYNTMLRGWAR